MVVVSLLIGCYYNVIITYTLRYLYESLVATATNKEFNAKCTLKIRDGGIPYFEIIRTYSNRTRQCEDGYIGDSAFQARIT